MKTKILTLTAVLALFVSASALATTDTTTPATSTDPNAATFQKVAPLIQSAQVIVAAPANDPLDAEITSLGGFPATADVNRAHRDVPHSFAIGYDAKGNGVVVVYLNEQNQPQVTTDTDALAVYQTKAHRLVATAPSGATADAQPDHSGPFGTSSTSAPTHRHSAVSVRGHEVAIGMTKAEVRKKLGHPSSILFEDTDHEQWIVKPFNPMHTLISSGITQLASNFGMFGGVAQGAGDSVTPKDKTYVIKFDGDTVCDINKMTM